MSDLFYFVFREGGLSAHCFSMDTFCVHRGSHQIQRPEEFSRGPVSSVCCALVSQCFCFVLNQKLWKSDLDWCAVVLSLVLTVNISA